ncbi:MAG TPA: thiamine pyrophosphate-dependent dehydrogenase E1 component subunit alpha [Planctomycetota bacterium]|nr:thiamine pyrophosphate-dependent dehydrogenase E1 component subunit alpha [Planctomycetota bacterium]
MEIVRCLPVAGLPANTPAPALDRAEAETLLRGMLLIRALDEKLLLMQRQGRIAFFGPSAGQEAAIAGSGFAAEVDDWIFPALREGGVLLMRGFPLARYFGQLFGNVLDVQKGRQMPMHFSSGAHKFVSLSSVIATQLPQAVGAAWAAKIRKSGEVVFGYIGDGGTSSGDFHAAMNFAAVGRTPCVIVCQNNQWAISVPFSKQTASDGVAVKAAAYGMPGVRVDGNDVLAVLSATRAARARAAAGEGPTLLELVTYRRGGHSSSDDPTRYRDEKTLAPWLLVDPIERFREWLRATSLIDAERDAALLAEVRADIDAALQESEGAAQPPVDSLFSDVYAELPETLAAQRAEVVGDGSGTAEGAFPL